MNTINETNLKIELDRELYDNDLVSKKTMKVRDILTLDNLCIDCILDDNEAEITLSTDEYVFKYSLLDEVGEFENIDDLTEADKHKQSLLHMYTNRMNIMKDVLCDLKEKMFI